MAATTVPVLVVGSGAAGTMLSLELARHGVEAMTIDRLPEPSRFSRAVTVHARTLEILTQIDPALAQRFLDRGVHSPGYVMHFVDTAGQRREVRPGLDFRDLPSRYRFLLVHSQDETEATLRDCIRERFGRQTQWGTTCTAVAQRHHHVEATLQRADGTTEVVECQYLVACDGGGSRIRKQLSFEQEGTDYAGTVLQNLDIELPGFPDDPDWIHYCMGPEHFVMVARMQNGYTRLLMSQPADKADSRETPQSVFAGILAQHFDGIRFGRTLWHSRWASQVRLAHTYRKDRVFLAGDAAHVHSTAGGQGMNCCMQDAYNLGWKLALVVKGHARPTLLDSYEAERKPIGKQVIAAASAIHELFMAGRNSGADALLALRHSGFLADLVGRVSGLSYHYRAGDTHDADDGMPREGDRMPDCLLSGSHAHLSLLDLFRHGGFTLLACVHGGGSMPLPRPRPGVVVEVLQPAPTALLPASSPPQLYLVRPDGYLALRCALPDYARIAGRLREILT